MTSDAIVSVVAYLDNDADLLGAFVDRTVAVLAAHYEHFELILLDDHSADNTPALAARLLDRSPGVRYIRLARHSGEEVATTAGLETVVGDYVVVMRVRFDPPEEIPEMVRLADRHGGSVLGVSATPPPAGVVFRWCRLAFYRLLSLFLRAPVPAHSTGYCALSRPAVNAVARTRAKRRHLRVLTCTIGFPVTLHTYVPTGQDRVRRPSLREGLRDALALTVSSSKTPLRLASATGILAGVLNLLYVCYVIGIYLFKRQVAPGWATLSLQISTLFFFVFLILVLLSEYVVQILEESQDNPLYHVEDDRTGSVPAGSGRPNVLAESTAEPASEKREREVA